MVLPAGIITTLAEAYLGMLAVALAMMGMIYPIQAVRWNCLTRARGLEMSLGQSFRLVMVGSFFNLLYAGRLDRWGRGQSLLCCQRQWMPH